MTSYFTQLLERTLKVLIFISFFIPLCVFSSVFAYPFIFSKILIFRILSELMAVCYAGLLFFDWRKYKPQITPVNSAIVVFLLSALLSSLFGVDFQRSLWDSLERMMGWVSLLHFALYALMLSNLLKTWDEWKSALHVCLFAGWLVMLIGWSSLYEDFYPDGRMIATLGNPVFLASYCLFLFFSAALLLFQTHSWGQRIYLALTLLAILSTLFQTGSRAAILALICALTGTLGLYSIVIKSKKTKCIFISLALICLGGLSYFYYSYETPYTLYDAPPLQRLFMIEKSDLQTPRFMAWKSAWLGWQERPILGWGPCNFHYIYMKTYSPAALFYGVQETRMDNAHNILLNTLAVQGLIGLLAYLSLYLTAFFSLYKGYRQGLLAPAFAILAATFLLAQGAMNLTLFDHPTSYLCFFFYLAMIDALTLKKIVPEELQSPHFASKPLPIKAFALCVSLSLLSMFFINIKPAFNNMGLSCAIQTFYHTPAAAIKPIKALANQKRAVHSDDIHFILSKTIIDYLLASKEGILNEPSRELSLLADRLLIEPLALHPGDIQLLLLKAKACRILAIQKKKPLLFKQARHYLERSLAISPHFQEVMVQLALVEIELGNIKTGLHLFEKALLEEPRVESLRHQYRQVLTQLAMKKRSPKK